MERPKYWLTPPELYTVLDSEFHFDFDPCPYPRPEGFDGLAAPWGMSNYVNPPFCRKDADGPFAGPSGFARKAIKEMLLGKTSVFVLPLPNVVGLLLEAGAEVRYAGKVSWLDTETKLPCLTARRQALVILRGKTE
jgi:hypothetical protein